jgi:hypothetical protein
VLSEELREGLRVRVNTSSTLELVGKVGTVSQTFGDPSYKAVEVRFDGGGSELFWHYQLEPEGKG